MWWVGLALAAPPVLSAASLEAGSVGSLTWSWTATESLEVGGAIEVTEPIFGGMTWAKWTVGVTDAASCSAESSESLARRGLVEVETDGAAALSVETSSSTDIHEERVTRIVVEEGALAVGDTVSLTWGGEDDCAWGFPPRAYPEVRFAAAIEDGSSLGDATLALVAGPLAAVAVVVPSDAVVGEVVDVRIVLLDEAGNGVSDAAEVVLETPDGWLEATVLAGHPGSEVLSWTPTEAGVVWLEGTVAGLEVGSNPVLVHEQAPQTRIFWGDLHTHHGVVHVDEDGVQHDDNHVYARDVVGLDFGSHSVKMAQTEIDGEDRFAEQQWACGAYTDEDYVAFLGLEWVGWGSVRSGHHNVYFDDCDGAWAAHADFDGLEEDGGLWAWMEELENAGTRSVSVPHATRFTGFDFTARDDVRRPVAEVYSTWGDSSLAGDGSIREALRMGQRWGLLASSDDHDGWLGNPFSEKTARGGLAALVAPQRSREALFEALASRRSYGTSGPRILVSLSLEDLSTVVEMGSAYVAARPEAVARVYGTAALEAVTLVVATVDGPIATHTLDCDPTRACEASLRLRGGGERVVWLEVDQVDGERAWSSPVFLFEDCGVDGVSDPLGRCDTAVDAPSDTDETGGGTIDVHRACGCRSEPMFCPGFFAFLALGLGARRRR